MDHKRHPPKNVKTKTWGKQFPKYYRQQVEIVIGQEFLQTNWEKEMNRQLTGEKYIIKNKCIIKIFKKNF